MDACGSDVPLTMSAAFRTVGMMLASGGQLLAGRFHLIFASELRNGEDEILGQLVLQSFRSPEIPLILKSEFPLFVPTENVTPQPWHEKYINALKFASRGRWRAARTTVQQLLESNPDQPDLIYAAAVWSMHLADSQSARQYLDRFSKLDTVTHDQAVEHRGLAFVVDESPLVDSYDLVMSTYEINNVEQFNEIGMSNRQTINGSMLGQSFIDPEMPHPINGFLILDKEEVRTIGEAKDDQFPKVVGELLVYGRQTDRQPRCEVFVVRDESFDQVHQILKDIFADSLNGKIDEQVVEQINILENDLSFKWHLPADMTLEQRQDFVAKQREKEYMQLLPQIAFLPLDGQSIEQAVNGDEQSRINAEAVILLMEQAADALASDSFDFNRLRDKYDLPNPQPVDTKNRAFDQLSPIETQRINFADLDDESLIKAYVLASSCGNIPVLRSAAPVILERPEMERFIHFEMVRVMMARLTQDTDEALEMMQKARSHALSAKRPIGGILIDELELRLERNRPDGCQELLRVLQTQHLQDPQNQYRLAMVLQRFGIMGPDGRMRSDVPEAAQPTEPTGIWTPDGAEAPAVPAAESGSETKSGLWLPE